MKCVKLRIIPFIAGLLLFLLMEPYFMWSLQMYQFYLVTIPLLLIFACNVKLMNLDNLVMFAFFAFILLLASLCNNSNIFGIISMVSLVFIPFVSTTVSTRAYKYYKLIYTTILVTSMIVWLLILFGLPIPRNVIPALNSLKDYDYFAYPFLVIPHRLDFSIEVIYGSLKFHGPFDEPGVIGTISLLMLFIDDFKLNNIQNRILLISGMLTFSLFFYLASFCYIFYLILLKNNKIYGFIIIFSFLTFYIVTKENDFMKQMLWNRMEWNNDEKTISGNNRSDEALDDYFASIRGTSIYFWGTSNNKLLEDFSGSASYKNAILTFGILTCGLYVIFFFIFAYKQIGIRKELLLFAVLFLLTLYQRPGLFSINYIFLFMTFIIAHSRNVYKNVYQKTIS